MKHLVSASDDQEKLPRKIGLWGLWMLVVNGFVGAGIFGLPSGAYDLAGEYSIYIYVACALLMLPVILSFAELGSYFRGTGGPIKYGTEAFGPFIGFQAGWLFYVARLISFAANSVLLTDSIGYFFDFATGGTGRLITLAIIIGGLTLVNVLGAVESIRSLAIFTVVKFSILLFLVFGGLTVLGSEFTPAFEGPIPPVSDLGAAALLLIYAFVGFEGAVVPAGESKNPERDMPLALLLGLGSVVILYMFIQLVTQAAVPNLGDTTSPLLDASGVLFGPIGAIILMIGVVASVTGNLVSTMFSTPRLTYALSIEGSLPEWFDRVHPKFLTPTNSVIFFGVLAFIFAALGSFTYLAAMTVLSRLFLFIISCGAIPKLRPRFRDKSPFILKGGYLIPVLGILACFWLMFQVSFSSIWLTALFIAIGTGLYLLSRNKPAI
ncbi:APC family permease [Gracilimonas amylolytica]|uniref:APC family permease n=1 Tax=Gracilimonas amylolytica TaxID=1749045 RepID=UPI000CD8F2E0|nr:APC family permease [Gracilimonas amylolytica]